MAKIGLFRAGAASEAKPRSWKREEARKPGSQEAKRLASQEGKLRSQEARTGRKAQKPRSQRHTKKNAYQKLPSREET